MGTLKPTEKKQYADKRDDLVSTWKGEDLLDGELTNSFTMIMRTRGCSWAHRSGCLMCGYHTASNPSIEPGSLLKQLETALSRYDGEKLVKIYTSGSFLDEREIPSDIAEQILSSFSADKIIVESRVEYVNAGVLESYRDMAPDLEIAVGLESTNDFVLENCINKGITVDDYWRARETIFSKGLTLRTYLLLKPPFLTEYEAIQDLSNSISEISHPMNTVSVNPVNVQKNSLLEKLWYRGEYRPPWLWSLLKAVRSSDIKGPLVISRAGLGSKRGAHNCGDCDESVIDIIDRFNLTGDIGLLQDSYSSCDCTEQWKAETKYGPLIQYRGPVEILSNRYAGYV